MKSITFDTPFEISGEWYLNLESESERLPGTLIYDQRDLSLEIFKTDQVTDLFPSLNGRSPRKLFGTLNDGSKITLHDVFETTSSISRRLSGLSMTIKYHVSECLRGGHFSTPPKFKKMSYRFPALDVWIDKTSVSLDHESMMNGSPPAPAIKVNWGNSMEFDIPSIEAKAKLHLGSQANSVGINGMQIFPVISLIIEPKELQQRDWYFDQYHRIRSFLSFVSGMQFWPSREIGILPRKNIRIEHLNSRSPTDYPNPLNKTEFRLDFSAISQQGSSLLNKWFELYDSMSTPILLYHGLQRQSEIDIDMRFISYMQALESLHREIDNKTYLSPEDYKQHLDVMLASIPSGIGSDHRSSIKSRLKYGYEYSLRTKMKCLVKLLDDDLAKEILGDNKFPGRWIDTRNYLTHRDNDLASQVLDGFERRDVLHRLDIFIWTLVLKIVGVDKEHLKPAVQKYLAKRIFE